MGGTGPESNPNPKEGPLAGLVGGTPRGWPQFYAGLHEVEASPKQIGIMIAAITMYLTLIT